MFKKITGAGLTFGTFLVSAAPVFAQIDVTPSELPDITVPQIVTTLIRLIVIAGFVISFIVLLVGGIRWMTAGGDPKNVEGARNMVTAALIGLVIVLAAFALVRLIEFIFGVTVISGGVTIPRIPEAPRGI